MNYTEIEETIVEKTLKQGQHALIVYNDDVNTFDHVIDTLKELCGHTTEQAEQCTYIIHYKGKCDVKRGSQKQLKPVFEALCERGLSAGIEQLI